MTDEEAQAIKARVDAAMPGPWWMTEDAVIWGGGHPHEHAPGDPDDLLDEIVVDSAYSDMDLHFIAHAREDIPALLAERSELRRMLADMYRVAVWVQEFHEYEFFEEFGDMTTLVGEVERTLKGESPK